MAVLPSMGGGLVFHRVNREEGGTMVTRRKQSPLPFYIMLLLGMVVLGGCANQPPPGGYDPPGFFSGLLHGFFIFFSLIGSIFMDIRIYAFPNSGFFYDLGYLIGAMFLGGMALPSLID